MSIVAETSGQSAHRIDTPMFPSVRMAMADDENGLVKLCELLHAENALFTMDIDLVRDLVRSCIYKRPSTHFPYYAMIGVIGEPGKLEGSICLRISQVYYSRDFMLEELWNFVHPDHRRSRNARALIRYAKSCADGLQLPLFISIVSNTRTEAKIVLYEQELKKMGAYFVYFPAGVKRDG